MSGYTIEEDSHYRRFIKEEGYGYIAEIELIDLGTRHAAERLKPMNKGVDMSRDDLEAARKKAINAEEAS